MEFEDFYSLATREGSSNALRAIAGMEKGRLARDKEEYKQLAAQKKAAEDNLKWTMGQLIGSYHQAKSTALQNQLRESMLQLYSVADPYLKPALEPLIRHSPISPEAEKARQFEEMNSEPPRPGQHISVTPSFGKGPFKEGGEPTMELVQELGAPQQYAEEYFNHSDWLRQRNQVVFGHGGDKQNFLSLPEGGAAIRTAEGRISIYDAKDLGLKDIAEKLGKTPADVIAGQGYLPSYTYIKQQGDQLIEMQVETAAIPGLPEVRQHIKSISAAPLSPKEPLPPKLDEFMSAYAGKDYSSKQVGGLAKRMTDLVEKEATGKIAKGTINAELRAVFGASHSYLIRSTKTPGTLYGTNTAYTIAPVRGRPAVSVVDPKSKKQTVLFLDENGTFYDAGNNPIGKYEDVLRIFKDVKEL